MFIEFIAYIYICFNQIFDEKSYISAKIEAIKHLHAIFLLAAEQCRCPALSDCRKPRFILKSVTSCDPTLLFECCSKNAKNVNIAQ